MKKAWFELQIECEPNVWSRVESSVLVSDIMKMLTEARVMFPNTKHRIRHVTQVEKILKL